MVHNGWMLKFALIALAASLMVLGCQKSISAKDYEGKWMGKASMSDADITKMVKSMGGKDSDVAQAKSMFASIKVELELKADKTYSLGQGQGKLEGGWDYKDMKVTLTPVKADGKSKEEIIKQFPQAKAQFEPLVLTSDKEGKVISGAAPGQPGQPGATLTFSRAEEPAKKA